MTTESVLTEPQRTRVAPTVLAGIGAFVLVGVYVLISSLDLGRTSLARTLHSHLRGRALVAMSALSLVQELRQPSETASGVDRGLVIAVVVSLALLAAVKGHQVLQLSCVFLMYHLKIRGRRGWVSSLIIALAGSVGAFYAFNYGLNVALPTAGITVLNSIGL